MEGFLDELTLAVILELTKYESMKDKYVKSFIRICVILLIITSLFPYLINLIFNDWAISGTFGDTFGALNALFSGLAFAGLITTILIQKEELGHQRDELKLQRDEMIETRKEFLLTRTTTLIYNQLERFEKSLKELKIHDHFSEFIGDAAIAHLDNIRKKTVQVFESTATDNPELEQKKQLNSKQSKIHIQNKIEIEKFAHNIYNSVEVLKGLIFNSSLGVEEMNELKKLFFDNIGFVNMGVIEHIIDVDKEQIKIFETEDYLRFDIEPGRMTRANIFLQSVYNFYKTKFTLENLDELKTSWRKNSGREN